MATPPPNAKFAARSAIEALRAGVPNPYSVRALGCEQPRMELEFIQQLEAAFAGQPARGLLIRGDFGTGKSHTLEYLREIALEQKFVCSHICISKETPLHDPAKLFEAATESAVAPGRAGSAFAEIANQLVFNSQVWRDFERWANQASAGLDARFPASLLLFERFQADHEFRDRLIRFWAGERLAVGEVKSRLRQIGEVFSGGFTSLRDLAIQRLRFATRLVRAAGYSGWVLLIDEVELIGTYSRLQRAKSYIEIGRIMTAAADSATSAIPVLAITEDFAHAVLEDKGDMDKIPALLQDRAQFARTPDVSLALAGMRILAEKGISLKRPGEGALDETYGRIRELYERAYDWQPPTPDGGQAAIRREQSTPIRAYIRRWITEWDLYRLYPGNAIEIETAEWRTDYTEDDSVACGDEETASDQTLIDDVLGDI
jgi:P-loop Domain of unknown function (DUF2791)